MKVTLQKKKRKVVIAPASKKDLLCGSFNAVGNPYVIDFYKSWDKLKCEYKKVMKLLDK